jgi:N4-gp56 family major capsid protein
MANEIDTGNSAGQIFENITQAAQFVLNENALLRQLVTVYDMQGTPGLTASVPVYPKLGALSALSAGADLSNSDIAATAVDITAAEFGAMATIQDIVVESSPLSVAQDAGSVIGSGIAQAMDEVIVDLFTSASTDVGPGAGSELTVEHILKAAATLRTNSVPMNEVVAVIHPKQAFNLKKTLLNSGTNPSANDLVNTAARSYFLGRVSGVDIYESASCDVDGSDDAIGAVFHRGAIGMVMKRDLRIATQRDESIRGFEIIGSAAFGAGILDQNKIVKMTADAAI